MGKRTENIRKNTSAPWDSIRPRIEYLCNFAFGGNVKALAKYIKMQPRTVKRIMAERTTGRLTLILKLVRSGVVNGNWLLAGAGPVRPCDHELPIDLPPPTETQFPLFDTRQVQYCLPEETAPLSPPSLRPADEPDSEDLRLAWLVYEARKNDKPVILFLNSDAITDDVGTIVVEMMKKGYVTAVALSSDAAERDLERALYGGWVTPSKRVESYNTLLNAASMAASNGLGWGLAAGRWCFPPDSDRQASVIASAYDLGVPVTIHLALGDCTSHLFPSLDGAARGAAMGAASYLDLLTFAEQVRTFATLPVHGLILNTGDDSQGRRLIDSAIEATTNSLTGDLPQRAIASISEGYRHSFPALLVACDAVYDGSADDGK